MPWQEETRYGFESRSQMFSREISVKVHTTDCMHVEFVHNVIEGCIIIKRHGCKGGSQFLENLTHGKSKMTRRSFTLTNNTEAKG